MPYLSPFTASTAALFGVQTISKAVVPAKPIEADAGSGASRTESSVKVVLSSDSNGMSENYEPQWARDMRASIANSEAAAATREAEEVKFEQENGFRKKVTSGLMEMYAKAQAGIGGTAYLENRSEAAEYVEHIISGMRTNAVRITFENIQLNDYQKPAVIDSHGDIGVAQLKAKSEDEKLAAEMDMFVRESIISKTFKITDPIYKQEDGKVIFTEMDISFRGMPLAHLAADGTLTLLDDSGQPLVAEDQG